MHVEETVGASPPCGGGGGWGEGSTTPTRSAERGQRAGACRGIGRCGGEARRGGRGSQRTMEVGSGLARIPRRRSPPAPGVAAREEEVGGVGNVNGLGFLTPRR